MPWQETAQVTNEEMSSLRHLRKAKLYADEDIEEQVVAWLRTRHVNIKSARETPRHRGKPDDFHAAYALRSKRFLLTKNTRDYIDDRKLPWEKTFGVIALSGDLGNIGDYLKALNQVVDTIVPYGAVFEKTKIQVSAMGFIMKARAKTGLIETQRFRTVNGRIDEWTTK